MKKTKKVLLAVLSSVFVVSASLGVAACSDGKKTAVTPVSITKITPEFAYIVGDNVHMFDHFEYVEGLTYTFTVAYEDEDAETVEGTAFYLAKEGNYTITCTATNGKDTKTDSVTITVGNEKAFIQFKTREADVEWMRSMWDTEIIALGQPVIVVDCEYEMYIDSVIIYDAVDGSGRTVDIESGVKIEDEAGTFYNGVDKFTFVYECDYVFTIACETSGGKVTNEFTVKAKENFDNLELLSDYSLEYDKTSYTATWDTVDGASAYYVKVDRKRATIMDTTIDIEDMLVSEFQYFDLHVVPLDASGNRMGKLVYEDVVIAPEGSDGLVKGTGATINAETKEVTLVGREAGTAGYESGIRHVENSYIAFGYKYGVGTYVDFEFTGNNLPQVCFFANEINANMTCHSGTAHLSKPNEGYLMMNSLCVTGQLKGPDSLICVGPYRFACSQHGNHINYIEVTEGNTKKYRVSSNSLFTYNGLKAAGEDQRYIYTVGSFDSSGKLAFEFALRDADTNEILETAQYVTGSNVSDVKPGHIIAYAGVKGDGVDTKFTYSLPYEGETLPESGVTRNDDGSVTLAGKTTPGGYAYHIAQLANSYLGIEGEYGVGTYIDITFTGNNMPEVLLFADEINGNMTSMGGTGLLFSNGLANANNNVDFLRKYYVFGPNRLTLHGGVTDTDKVVQNTNTYEGSDSRLVTLVGYASGTLAESDYPYLTQYGLAQTPDTEYKYTVGTYENGGKVYLYIELYDLTNDKTVYTIDQATNLSASDLTAGSIVLYGTVAGEANSTTFKYSEPYTKQAQ